MSSKLLFFLCLPFLLFTEEIEVRLKTVAHVKPLYLAHAYIGSSEVDHAYVADLRKVLQFDLNVGAFVSVLPTNTQWEESLHMPDVKRHFTASLWRKEQVPYIICSTVTGDKLRFTAFDVEKGNAKVYEELTLTGRLEEDRRQIHRLSDTIHRDLFGVEGISSCRIIYSLRESKSEGGYRSEIYLSDFDGINRKQLTYENDYCVTPCFSPVAKQAEPTFFYVSYKTGQSKIYRSSLNGSKKEEVFDLGGNQLLPSLNLRGTKLAFISDIAGRPDLFIQNLDSSGKVVGKPKQLFSAPRATQASSTFSPDGKKIAFVSDKDGPPRIYTIDLTKDGKVRPELITKRNRENTSPAWSPDGKKLSYSCKIDGVRQIWIYDFETQEEMALTAGPENKENPAWAPDSLHLVYNTDQNEMGELFLIDLNQKMPLQISKGPGQKRFASWEPRKF